jgi:phosphoserine phosphatase RsbU/P
MIISPLQVRPAGITERSAIPRILVVDDDLTSRLMLEAILRKEGFLVSTAESGEEGLELAAQLEPELILMDVNMPGMSGLAACARLNADPGTGGIPVIFISAVEDVNAKIEGFNAGGVDYITKPFNPIETLARVRLHIRMKHAYQSLVSAQLAQIEALGHSQKLMLPQPEDLPEAGFSVIYAPCHQAGGDFYDVFQAGERIYDYVVADISGHSLETALPTAALKALIRQNASMLYSPAESLTLLNRTLRPVLAEGQYATLAYARINQSRRKLEIISAGHPPALIVRRNGKVIVINQPGDALGLFDSPVFEAQTHELLPGDRIFLFSDGLLEQVPGEGGSRRKGLTALVNVCETTYSLPIEDSLQRIMEMLVPPRQSLLDDVVVLAFEI